MVPIDPPVASELVRQNSEQASVRTKNPCAAWSDTGTIFPFWRGRLLFEVAVEEALESATVPGLVFGHLVHSVVDGI